MRFCFAIMKSNGSHGWMIYRQQFRLIEMVLYMENPLEDSGKSL